MVETFTPEELAELAAFDATLDAEEVLILTDEEIAESKERDAEAKLEGLSRSRAKAQKAMKRRAEKIRASGKRAEYDRQYRAAHKDKLQRQIEAWRQANREYRLEYQRRYDAAHREERLAAQRRRSQAKKEAMEA